MGLRLLIPPHQLLHNNSTNQRALQAPHVLQAAPQKKIHDQAWQPLSDCTLAVAHAAGVSLWRHVDQSRSPAMHRLHLQKGVFSAVSTAPQISAHYIMLLAPQSTPNTERCEVQVVA